MFFSSTSRLRNAVEVREVERRSVSPTFNTLSSSQSLSKDHSKIESNELNVSIPIKTSFVSQCDNSSIYEWRKRQKAPIVRVIEVGQVNETDPLTGLPCLQKTIRAEPFVHTLKTYVSFSKEQMLLVFKCMLEGHQAIFKKLKATSVCLEQCIITTGGEVRVWVNCRFQRNEIAGKIVTSEEDIVRKVFQDLILLASHNKNGKIQEFIEYVRSTLRRTRKWTFPSLNAMIKSYSDCLKLRIPKTINSLAKTLTPQNDTNLKGNFISQQPPKLKRQRHHNSFLCASSDRSASLLGVGTLRRLSYNPKSGKRQIDWAAFHKAIFNRTATSKSITDKDVPTLRSLTIKSNNSSSISNFNSSTGRECFSQRASRNSKQNLVINHGEKRVRRISGVEKILIHEIGIPTLKQVIDEDCSSPSVKKSFTSSMTSSKEYFEIAPQFTLKVEHSVSKPERNSSISTTNQTSASAQLCFAKKQKQNDSTILQKERKESSSEDTVNLITASRDRFWVNKNTLQESKTINSCTNWSNRETFFSLNMNLNNHEMIKQVEASTILPVKDQPIFNSPFQNSSIPNTIHLHTSSSSQLRPLSTQNFTPALQSHKQIKKQNEGNPYKLLADLAVQEQAESYYHSEKNSSSCSRSSSPKLISKQMNFEDKVIELISLNKNLAKSTYMETNSQRKIFDSPRLQGRRRLKEIEETLEYIMKANVKQQEVIEENCWTKKVHNLLGPANELLRQSIVLDGTGKGFKEVDSPRHCKQEIEFGSQAAFNTL